MTWVLWLYPPRWRRRYGPELAALLAAQPRSFGTLVDLIAGALDAWSHPDLTGSATQAAGGTVMVAERLRLKCAGYGPDVTRSDRAKSAAVNLGGALALALLWLWALSRFGRNVYLMAAGPLAYLLPYLVSLHYTALKGCSRRAQAIVVGSIAAGLMALFLGVAWIGVRL